MSDESFGRYSPPIDRIVAIELIMAAFAFVAPERVNTPPQVTMTQCGLSLHILGVTTEELEAAAAATGTVIV